MTGSSGYSEHQDSFIMCVHAAEWIICVWANVSVEKVSTIPDLYNIYAVSILYSSFTFTLPFMMIIDWFSWGEHIYFGSFNLFSSFNGPPLLSLSPIPFRLLATNPSCQDACEAASRNITSWLGRGSAIASGDSSSSSVSARPQCVTSSSNTWWAWRCCYPLSTLSVSKSPTSLHTRWTSLSWATRASSGQKGKRRREQRRWGPGDGFMLPWWCTRAPVCHSVMVSWLVFFTNRWSSRSWLKLPVTTRVHVCACFFI